MQSEIIINIPQKELIGCIDEIVKDLNIKVRVLDAAFETAVDLAKELIGTKPDFFRVIISGGATLKLLRQEFPNVTFVNYDPTEYDVLLALKQARMLGNVIGLFHGDYQKLAIMEQLADVLGLVTRGYVYGSMQEVIRQLGKAKQDGVDVVVGVGQLIGDAAHEIGFKYISLWQREHTIRSALERAVEIVEAEVGKLTSAKKVDAIAANSNEGISAVDENGIVTLFNPVASRLFGLSEEDVVGRSLNDLTYANCLVSLFDSYRQDQVFEHEVRTKVVLVNRVPIVVRGSFEDTVAGSKGTLVTFREMTKFREETGTRRELIAKGLVAKHYFENIVHVNSRMTEVLAKARKFAGTDCTVLIRGESGTGKELLAQSIHNGHRKRCNKPFVAVNAASLEDSLLRSELFGYVEGAFTGASKGGKPGLFEVAQGGTLFLDEVGKMKLDLQASLLRVLQEKEVRRIGSDRIIPVDVRIIAASNENLEELVSKGSFREDLYFRLNVLNLNLPPLRQRKEDIPRLTGSLLKNICRNHAKPVFNLPQTLFKRLSEAEWPGNIRQLENVLERCVVLSDNESEAAGILLELLEDEFGQMPGSDAELPAGEGEYISVPLGTLADMTAELVRRISKREGLSNSELALKLGISRPTLIKMLNSR
ncbi:MAG TPA: sigma 54-interacting transcriptional regulator [Bacillota bacterium]|nr:sigma 54-interacting transcriptional regulator [Bacillota bacterium]